MFFSYYFFKLFKRLLFLFYRLLIYTPDSFSKNGYKGTKKFLYTQIKKYARGIF